MDQSVLETLRTKRVLAILRGVPRQQISTLTQALIEGGISAVEVTFSDADAAEKIEALTDAFGSTLTVGAGTVSNAEQAVQASRAGARFLVTPHVADDAIRYGCENGLPVISGALTPGEIASAIVQGASMVKVFPAAVMGVEYFRALRGPYPNIELMAVGGIGPANAAAYLEAGAVALGVGGALTSLDWSAPDYASVEEMARSLVHAASGL